MGNSLAVESLFQLLVHSCGRLTDTNRLLLPTAVIVVTFLWFRMRPIYRLVKAELGANADAYSAEFNLWWANGGAPQVLVLVDRASGR